ncbi:MAG: lysophospholipid acyltransferase family protein [Ignavibacteriales bacterium]|nr:lysophospholipid acyltransferase family protein [Ignavibacteriales bacterium]
MLRSALVWLTTCILILLWFVLLAVSRLFDRDPVHYRTGYLFRKIGNAITWINSAWRLHITGEIISDPRRPYVVVCNHQSMADIPLISNLPWEMKWLGKVELFKLPILGWMMWLAGDISVDRKNPRSGAQALIKAQHILQQKCSVMIFPEGTRTLDGRVRQFTDGAFHLAIRAKVPILPLVIEGSRDCIPKNSWKFGKPSDIFLKVLQPIETSSLTIQDVPSLRDSVRSAMMKQIAEWRSVSIEDVDGMQVTPPES